MSEIGCGHQQNGVPSWWALALGMGQRGVCALIHVIPIHFIASSFNGMSAQGESGLSQASYSAATPPDSDGSSAAKNNSALHCTDTLGVDEGSKRESPSRKVPMNDKRTCPGTTVLVPNGRGCLGPGRPGLWMVPNVPWMERIRTGNSHAPVHAPRCH